MSIQQAYISTKAIETLENYSISDDWKPESISDDTPDLGQGDIYDERYFWKNLFDNPENQWNRIYEFGQVGLSEWVARVPGLFWYGDSPQIRQIAKSQIEIVTGKWKHYKPQGKSQKVIGGVGSICLPPNDDGWYLASISGTNNASTGIPVLISEEVWDYHKLKEGSFILYGKGKWRKMSTSWAKRFPSTANIPKGYLVIKNPDDLEVAKNEIQPTIYHPFSIMEYEKQGSTFYDFVYVTVDSSESKFRDKIKSFFGEYRNYDNRNGQYLIEPFINNPLISDGDILYQSPAELRAKKDTKSHLALMREKIQQETFKGQTLEAIKIAIDNNYTIDNLVRHSNWIQINPNTWNFGGTVNDVSAGLIGQCLRSGKLEELVDSLVEQNNSIFTNL